MKTILLALLIFLLACSPPTGLVDIKTHPRNILTEDGGYVIQLTVYRKKPKEKLGEALWSPSDNKCKIYYKKLDYKTAGHELRHCIDGAFHKEQ